MPSLPDTAVCLHCGYSLRGLPENVCPECGRGFDPGDDSTWRDACRLSLFVRVTHSERGPKAPTRNELNIVVGLTIFLLMGLSASWVTVSGYLYLSALLLLLVLVLHLGLGAVLAAAKHIHANMTCPLPACPLRHPSSPGRSGRRWAIVAGCLAMLIVFTHEPRLLNYGRLLLSRSSFHRKAAASAPVVEGRQWVGLVQVDLIRRPDPDTVVFEIDWDRWGGTFSVSFQRRYSGRMPVDPVLGEGWGTGWGRFSLLSTLLGR